MRRWFRLAELLANGEGAFTLRAWLAAPWVELALDRAGLETTLTWLERAPARFWAPRAVGIEPGERAVARAFRAHPWLSGRCLPRALVQYLLHRRDGVPVRFVIGVKRPTTGLDAHAWVEAPDAAVDNDYSPILRTEPS